MRLDQPGPVGDVVGSIDRCGATLQGKSREVFRRLRIRIRSTPHVALILPGRAYAAVYAWRSASGSDRVLPAANDARGREAIPPPPRSGTHEGRLPRGEVRG